MAPLILSEQEQSLVDAVIAAFQATINLAEDAHQARKNIQLQEAGEFLRKLIEALRQYKKNNILVYIASRVAIEGKDIIEPCSHRYISDLVVVLSADPLGVTQLTAPHVVLVARDVLHPCNILPSGETASFETALNRVDAVLKAVVDAEEKDQLAEAIAGVADKVEEIPCSGGDAARSLLNTYAAKLLQLAFQASANAVTQPRLLQLQLAMANNALHSGAAQEAFNVGLQQKPELEERMLPGRVLVRRLDEILSGLQVGG